MTAEEKQAFIRDIIECVRNSTATITIFNSEDDYTGLTYTVVDADQLIFKLQELL